MILKVQNWFNRYLGHYVKNGYYLKHCIHYEDNGIYILSGGEDDCIYAWDVDSAEIVLKMDKSSMDDDEEMIDTTNQEQNQNKAIVWWVDSSYDKKAVGCVDSYGKISVYSY